MTPDTTNNDINTIGNSSSMFTPPAAPDAAPDANSAPLRSPVSPVSPVQGGAPQQTPAPSTAPAQPAHHAAFKNFFGQIFGTTTPIYGSDGNPVTDPNTGAVATRPKTVKDSAKTVLSAALASLAASLANQPQDLGGGQWVSNANASAAASAQIGQRFSPAGQMAAAQAQADQNRMRQYQTFDLNTKAHMQALHLAELQRADATAQDDDIATRQAFHDAMLNEKQEDGTPYIDQDHRDMDESDIQKLMASDPKWVLSHSAIHSGYKNVIGADGKPARVETYDIFNNNGQIKVTQNLADDLGLPKELVGNPMNVSSLSQRVGSAAVTQSVTKTFNAASKALSNANGQSLTGDISLPALIKIDPSYANPKKQATLMRYAAYAGNPGAMMDAAEKNGDGAVVQLLSNAGVDREKWALKTETDKRAADKKAADSDDPDKQPAPKELVDSMYADIRKTHPSLSADQAATLVKQAGPNPTQGKYGKVMDDAARQANENIAQQAARDKSNAQKLDPSEIDVLSDQLLEPDNLTTMKDIGGRGSQKAQILAAAKAKAKARGIPFDMGLVDHRVTFLNSYEDPKGRAAINRQSINNIMMHAGDLSDLNEQNRRAGIKVFNVPINAIKDQFSDQYTNYKTASGVLKDELSLYFAGGYAPSKDQQDMWNKIQSDTATPAQTEAFAKEVIHLGLRRANTFNQQFRTNMGYDDPNMITPDARAAAQHLGMGDAVSQFGSGRQLGDKRNTQPQTRQTPQMPLKAVKDLPDAN